MKLKFHVLSFASKAIDIVDITDSAVSGSTEDVIWNLESFDYHSRILSLFLFFLQSLSLRHTPSKNTLVCLRRFSIVQAVEVVRDPEEVQLPTVI